MHDSAERRWKIIATKDLAVDPARFQAKSDAGEDGAGPALRDVDAFNEDSAGILSVWRDPADERTYVLDGHDRFELAKRTGHSILLVQYLDCDNAGEAFCKSVLLNIAQFVQSERKTLDAIEYRRAGVERAFLEGRLDPSEPATRELLKYYPDLRTQFPPRLSMKDFISISRYDCTETWEAENPEVAARIRFLESKESLSDDEESELDDLLQIRDWEIGSLEATAESLAGMEEDRQRHDRIAGLPAQGAGQFDLAVSRDALIKVARQLLRFDRPSASKCRLSWDGKFMRVSIGESDSEVPAGGTWSGAVEVPRLWLRCIAQKPPAGDPFEIRVVESKLIVNGFSVTCSVIPGDSSATRESEEGSACDDEPPSLADMRDELIDRAATVLRCVHLRREALETLVRQRENRPNIRWKMEEHDLNKCLGEAWVVLAPLGVTPDDLRELVMRNLRDAWK